MPAPKSLINSKAAAEVAAVNTSGAGNQNAVLSRLPRPTETTSNPALSRVAHLSFGSADEVMSIGEKRRFAVELKSDTPLGLAVLALRFDPKVVKVTAVSAGTVVANNNGQKKPTFAQSIDPSGLCLISISTLNGVAPLRGVGTLVYIDVEAIASGDAGFLLDRDTMHVVASDSREVVLELTHNRATVRQ